MTKKMTPISNCRQLRTERSAEEVITIYPRVRLFGSCLCRVGVPHDRVKSLHSSSRFDVATRGGGARATHTPAKFLPIAYDEETHFSWGASWLRRWKNKLRTLVNAIVERN